MRLNDRFHEPGSRPGTSGRASGCWMLVLLVLLGIAGVAALSKKRISGMSDKERHVQIAWTELRGQHERRMDFGRDLLRLAEDAKGLDKDLATGVARARQLVSERQLGETIPDSFEALEAYLMAQDRLADALERLLRGVHSARNFADGDERVANAGAEWTSIQNRIDLTYRDYAEFVFAYNAAIRPIPDMLLARLSGLKHYPQPELPVVEGDAEAAPPSPFAGG